MHRIRHSTAVMTTTLFCALCTVRMSCWRRNLSSHRLAHYLTYFIFVLVFDEASLRFDFTTSPPHQSHPLIA